MYAILDIETTGGSPANDKITEIAVFIHDGEKIINEFSTLINPERNIPYFITALTGITNEMVADAPKFYEVAGKIVELTEGCVIVGHNVHFDYGFIRSEFKQLGYDFERQTLCTVKLSRKFIPGLRSYSLGNLCENLKIKNNSRHRAEGDAMATVQVFELILNINKQAGLRLPVAEISHGKIRNLNGYLKPDDINTIPAETGIYYLHDSEGNLLYLGKSKNIHKRILGHLANRSSRRAGNMRERIAGISYELTGSELIALLKESHEIKELKPLFNRAQKRTFSTWGLYESRDSYGYINFRIKKIGEENTLPLTTFNNKKEAVEFLTKMAEKYWLCQKLCGLYDTQGSCFHYEIRQCNGACIQKEAKSVYNERAQKLIRSFEFDHDNFLIIDKGRTLMERSLVCVENGLYKGFGYLDISNAYFGVNEMLECIQCSPDNKDVRQIIKSWLARNKAEKVIRY